MSAHLRRLLTALALACSGLVLTGLPAQGACTCKDGATVAQQARKADVVFNGVLQTQERRARQRVYTLDVQRVYQGRVAGSPVEVASGSTTCGLGRLESDRTYVVFATGSSAGLESEKCTGTGRATAAYVADVERVLGPGNAIPDPPVDEPAPDPEYTRVETSEPPEFTRIAAPGGAMVLLGLLGLVLFRKRA